MRRGENPSEVLEGVHEAVDDLNATGLPPGVRIVADLRPHRPGRQHPAHGLAHAARRAGHRGRGAVPVPGQRARRAADRHHHPAVAAVRLRLHALHRHSGEPAEPGRARLRHHRRRHAGDGGAHRARARRSAERRIAAGPPACSTPSADAALEVERPIFFSLLIIISAYIPLFTLERVERRLFTPMAFTVCYALLGSMLLALTLIPVLATYLFRNGAKSWENPVLAWLLRRATSVCSRHDRRPCRGACWRAPRPWSPPRSCSPRRSARSSCRSSTKASSGSAPTSPPASRSRNPRSSPSADPRARQAVARKCKHGQLADRPQRLRDRSVRPQPQRVLRRAQAVRHLAAAASARPTWSKSCRQRLRDADSRRRSSASRSRSSTTSPKR